MNPGHVLEIFIITTRALTHDMSQECFVVMETGLNQYRSYLI